MMTAILILSLPALVYSVSSGIVSLCDITPDYGCPPDQYVIENNVPNRLKCKDPTRIMAWATQPVSKPDWYTLSAGDENKPVTSYTPGARIMINLRVKQYNQQYRGILLYAHSSVSNVTKVGDWDFVDRSTMFHGWCPKSVLHSSAELKPYLTQWAFTAPPKGTGTITFRAMLKVGVANEGEFYFPNIITLTEAAGAPPKQSWFRAAVQGQSCDEVCAANCNMKCDATQLTAIDTADKLETNVAPFIDCAKPYLVRCGREGVTSSDDGLCYYHSSATCSALGLTFTAATCAFKPTQPEVGFRICPCTGSTTCTQPPKTDPTTAATTRRTVTLPAATVAPAPGATTRAPAPGQSPAVPAPGATTAPVVPGAPTDAPAPGETTMAAKDPCMGDATCPAGCKCDSPRVCQVGLTLIDGVCLQTSCDPQNPTTGCRCTDKCGTTTVDGTEEKLQCNNGFCTLVLRRTCDDHLGTPGCWCTEHRTCDDGLTCSVKNNNCVVDDLCHHGDNGCNCLDDNSCNAGLACSDVAGGKYCLVQTAAPPQMLSSASTLAGSMVLSIVLLSFFA